MRGRKRCRVMEGFRILRIAVGAGASGAGRHLRRENGCGRRMRGGRAPPVGQMLCGIYRAFGCVRDSRKGVRVSCGGGYGGAAFCRFTVKNILL